VVVVVVVVEAVVPPFRTHTSTPTKLKMRVTRQTTLIQVFINQYHKPHYILRPKLPQPLVVGKIDAVVASLPRQMAA
jgi:hypothetical protein